MVSFGSHDLLCFWNSVVFICACFFFFFFNDTATTEIYTLSLHDALPIPSPSGCCSSHPCTAMRVPSGLQDRKSTRLNSSHPSISYAVFCLKKKTTSLRERQGRTRYCNGARDGRCGDFSSLSFFANSSFAAVMLWFLFFKEPSTSEIYTLSLHDALPI